MAPRRTLPNPPAPDDETGERMARADRDKYRTTHLEVIVVPLYHIGDRE